MGALLRFGPLFRFFAFLTALRFVVQGDSMQPNFARDQYILVSRMAYLWRGPLRGDVVVLRYPPQWPRSYLKRVIGLPGETVRIEDGEVFIDEQPLREPYIRVEGGSPAGPHAYGLQERGSRAEPAAGSHDGSREWTLGDGQCFVMGDNRADSLDSRSLGAVNLDQIVGKAWIRYWPKSSWGIIR